MSESPLVSIIVPIYNVEKYLRYCLDSILAQTYKNLEIILVDDKSPDNSGQIADEYATKDARIKVIHKSKNEGLNMARATGFKASSGQWITFVDSDDLLHPQFTELLIRGGGGNYMSICSQTFFTKRADIEFAHISDPQIYSETDKELLISYETIAGFPNLTGHPMTVWGKMYKRNLLADYDWNDSNSQINEDEFMTPRLLLATNGASFIVAPLYFYRTNSEGTLSKQIRDNIHNNSVIPFAQFPDYLYKNNAELCERYGLNVQKYLLFRYYLQLLDRWKRLKQADLLKGTNKKIVKREVEFLRGNKVQFEELWSDEVNVNLKEVQRNVGFIGHLGAKAMLLAGNIKRKLHLRTRVRAKLANLREREGNGK